MKSFVVLLSSGMDSTVNFYRALEEGDVKLAITFNYGQKAATKEIERAKQLTKAKQVPHRVIELPFFRDFGKSSLINENEPIPLGEKVQIESLESSRETAKSVWVPNRNGIFLNIAAGFAEALNAEAIVPGFNLEEAVTFPDNSVAYIGAVEKSLDFSTSNQVKVKCWTQAMTKEEIVREGLRLKVDWSLIWPCYQVGDLWCGECESCRRAERAFQKSNVDVKKFYK